MNISKLKELDLWLGLIYLGVSLPKRLMDRVNKLAKKENESR